MKKQYKWGLGVLVASILISGLMFLKKDQSSTVLNIDDAILAIIKNDEAKFVDYMKRGGDVKAEFSLDGKSTSLVELIIQYERINFLKTIDVNDLRTDKVFWKNIVAKNNSALLTTIKKILDPVELDKFRYDLDRHLLHVSSVSCFHQVVPILEKSKMKWSDLDGSGASALTLAAEHECLNLLSYWKLQKADFFHKDKRGQTAHAILLKKKDPALLAFAQSFEPTRTAASVPNFYNKRKIPKAKLADRSHLIEPELRPDDANETSEFSEFSD